MLRTAFLGVLIASPAMADPGLFLDQFRRHGVPVPAAVTNPQSGVGLGHPGMETEGPVAAPGMLWVLHISHASGKRQTIVGMARRDCEAVAKRALEAKLTGAEKITSATCDQFLFMPQISKRGPNP